MQIVVPMSGFGERFRRAGYSTPKPLIEVENKPIIQHVIEMFPGDQEFIFVCNQEHLENKTFKLFETLNRLAPSSRIIGIEPHKRGPVHAVLKSLHELDLDSEIIVNYADFTCMWNFAEFARRMKSLKADGGVPAYKGFHPHSAGTTNYAYIHERNGQILGIREKQPFTENKVEEFASSGTYFFKSGHLMKHYLTETIEKNVSVNGEFYVSSSLDLMAAAGMNVQVHEIRHFMQWGTPEDLNEYLFWSDALKQLSRQEKKSLPINGIGSSIILASGRGERFRQAGYAVEKPLLRVSGATLLEQISKSSMEVPTVLTVSNSQASKWVGRRFSKFRKVETEQITSGQAMSAKLAIDYLNPEENLGFTIFPCDSLFASTTGPIADQQNLDPTLTVWVARPSSFSLKHPESFSWIQGGKSEVLYALKSKPYFENALIMTGAFSFSSKDVFNLLYGATLAKGHKINGELYLDSFVEVASDLNVKVCLFEPDFSLALGTPYEFETFRYWQACFDQWSSHPYSLETDPFVDLGNLEVIRHDLSVTKHSPAEWKVE